ELYGPDLDENRHISVDELEIEKILSVSKRQVINLQVDDNSYRTMLKAIEFHPVTDRPIHVDFYVLSDNYKVSLSVPIRLKGTAIGVRDGGGRVYQPMHIVNIRALPEDIPGEFDVDITDLDIGDNLHVRDLELEEITLLDDPGQ